MGINRDIKKAIITVAGYFWFSLTFIWMIFEITEFSFYTESELRGNKGVFISVFFVSIILAILIYQLYPTFEEIFDRRKSDGEKYTYISQDNKYLMSKMLIHSNLNYMNDDMSLLDPICDKLFFEKDYDEAIRIGIFNSSILLRLDKHYLRVINGLYILDALDKWVKYNGGSKESNKYKYIENFVRINDLGWSLYSLEKNKIIMLLEFIERNNDLKYINDNYLREELSLENYKDIVVNELTSRKQRLIKKKCFYKLVCQSLRHLSSIHPLQAEREGALELLEKYCGKIKNYKDSIEMKSNLLYLKGKIKFKESETSSDLEEAINYIKKASNGYKKIGDADRYVKCYGLRGDVYKARAHLDSKKRDPKFLKLAYDCYYEGYIECRKISRYDGLIKNLKGYIELAEVLDIMGNDILINSRIGLKIAKITQNQRDITYFRSICKPNHIILIRHGESKKNIDKIINGEGDLTEDGKARILIKAQDIKEYLDRHNITNDEVKIYGQDKKQVTQSIRIFSEFFPEAKCVYDDNLRPTKMGVLFEKSEDQLNVNASKSYKSLIKWRNKEISAAEICIDGMEDKESYWSRAEKVYDEIEDNTCSIVVCTTSVAILLTHYILGNDVDSDNYKCFDVPLGGIIHFINNFNMYELCNKDHLTNIKFTDIENTFI